MRFCDDMLLWYDACARKLPWRGERDPYRIWLSEIMLQQTQTETVKGYYARFLDTFPNVRALAEADEDAVLKLWEGLGYYSRARNLHAAAKRVAFGMDGVIPKDAEGLRALPGIGPYAANAIASIAYDEPVPALDGNQARVLSRILAWDRALATPFDLLSPASDLMSHERPGDYNQALMDLGASICTPKSPHCDRCPVRRHCRACAEDAVLEFPKKPAPIAKKQQAWTVVVMTKPEGLIVRRRPKGLLGGLYEFVAVEGHHDPDALQSLLRDAGFENARVSDRLPDARHVFTHLIWHMQGYRATCDTAPDGYITIDRDRLESLAFPGALRVYRECVEI